MDILKNYRVIDIPLNPAIQNNEINEINNAFRKYSKYDIFLKIQGENAKIFLHSIDLKVFKNDVDSFFKNNQHSLSLAFFKTLLEQIESIKSYGLKGSKRVFVGYNNERKVKNRLEKETKRQQYFYAQNNYFSEKNNGLPEKFMNKIICADSKALLSELPDNCIDIIVTSPPYNFGLEYKCNQDAHHWQNYFDELFLIFNECIRVLKYGGRIIVNIQPLFSDYIPSHHIISNFFINKKLIWKGEVIWEKNNYNCKYTAWGSWKSPSNPYLKYTWEFLEIFCKGSLKKEGKYINADIMGDEFKKWVVAKWEIAPERNMKQFGHPAMFPEELVIRVLKLFSFKNDIVLDPFNGAGTTTLVAKRLNRKYLGIDISEQYCKIAQKRIESVLF
jgi:DNA modification methylase